MFVQNLDRNPFKASQSTPVPRSTRILSTGNFQITMVEPVPMTMRTTKRAPPKDPDVKTLEDFTFKPLKICWKNDYDIITVHRKVLGYLKTTRDRRDALNKNISALRVLLRSNISIEEISSIRLKISDLDREVSKLDCLSRLDYTNAVEGILNEYREISQVTVIVAGQKIKQNSLTITRKMQLVAEFLEISKEYCPMEIIREFKGSSLCRACNGIVSEKGDRYACIDCDTIQPRTELQEEGGDSDSSAFKRIGYESAVNFQDIVLQFQVAYPVNIPERILETIRSTIAQYQAFDIDKLTKSDLVKIMKEQNLGSWYKHLNKIYMQLTGKKPMDISKYVRNLFRRGELLYEIYDQIKSEDRSNFMHGLYLLWLFLKNEGCNPDMDDFVLLKSRRVEIANIETLTKGFKILRQSHPEFKWEIYQIP